jgi:tetratricopeptide (TPR) repeat protein
MSIRSVAMLVAFAGGLCACANVPNQNSLTTKEEVAAVPDAANLSAAEAEAFRRLYAEGEHNAVLNLNELGLAAMEAGQYARAEKAFDEALRRIEAIYANNENAKHAKSVWAEEKVKDFKGEPYERVMSYYYRGLLYARRGDYQNARASFLAADYQDTVAEKEEYQGDFGLMTYMAAWASACDGDSAKAVELHSLAMTKDNEHVGGLSPTRPMLYLLDAGSGPSKTTEGKHQEVLTFTGAPGSVDIPGPFSPRNNSSQRWVKAGDLFYQATTRGGRAIQGVLNGKAQWKEGTETAGNVAMTVGTSAMYAGLLSDNNNMAQAGSVAALAGLFLTIGSDAMKPTADTRQWATLPYSVYAIADSAFPAQGPSFSVDFQTVGGAAGKATIDYWGQQGACAIAWGRTRPAGILADKRKLEPAKKSRDKALQRDLSDKFTSLESKS